MADEQPTYVSRLAVGAAALTIGLTGVTFWLSYEALHDLAAHHHLTGDRAWAWPATIDAFVIVGEILILRASLLHRVDWLAVLLVASGSVTSIVLNVASVGASVDSTSRVVAAVPPVAALLAFTALMRQLYRALSPTAVSAPVTADLTRADAPSTPVVAEQQTPVIPPMPQAAPEALPPAPRALPAYSDPRCTAIRPLYNNGTRPGTKQMRDAITAAGLTAPSDGTIRGKLRTEIEFHEPHLAALPAAITAA